ncbi:MAG: hypothetical protein MAG451_00982 [Anaerolineales bacterium]|nr:hypothetical protein [Anaerolineales bacterium]
MFSGGAFAKGGIPHLLMTQSSSELPYQYELPSRTLRQAPFDKLRTPQVRASGRRNLLRAESVGHRLYKLGMHILQMRELTNLGEFGILLCDMDIMMIVCVIDAKKGKKEKPDVPSG